MKIKIIYRYLRSLILAIIACYFFLIPFSISVLQLNDPNLKNAKIPQFAYSLHETLSEKISLWANERVSSLRAATINMHNISATEWPMFSAVYFLWSTEALQKDFEKKNSSNAKAAPKTYAKSAIEAAIKLVIDPNNATWVKSHWGSDYLYKENIFYRMLLIAGLTSYQKITHNQQHQALLIKQIETLSQELDSSPYGLLDDYPGQCYPVDILPALAVIQRADKLLGTDHSAFLSRSIRAFEGDRLDDSTHLPAYVANSKNGQGFGFARGVGISYMLIWAPELWPNTANDWYKNYEKHFWYRNKLLSGFREFPKSISYYDWSFEIDAGPIVDGLGVAASAFGIGAARANGHFEHAYPLMSEAIVLSWPLLDGTLLIPRGLSNLSDAPYLGESALLFNMTRLPVFNKVIDRETELPLFVYCVLLFYLLCGLVILRSSILSAWQCYQNNKN
ncbi:hypothetical protein [Aliikangiella sp. IMCC44359]|uniref:hypothetical protein n=1 Tax=Aliikangiella sp. IMCC44359 TaxID=3459125 RepID=UPI00403B30BD